MKKSVFAVNPRMLGGSCRKYHRGYAEPGTAEQVMEMLADERLKQTVSDIRGGQEQLKDQLPTVCPHYSEFRNNHRAQQDIIAEAFTYKTCIDIDDETLVEQAVNHVLEMNADPMSEWEDKLLYAEYSPRKKVHFWILLPVGMTVAEAQQSFCDEAGIPYDESCTTPERYIYMTGDEIYRSERFLQPLTEAEVEERREAFLMRGLDVDGQPLKSHEAPVQQQPVAHQPAAPVAADQRTRYIFREAMKRKGVDDADFIKEGGRHNVVKMVLSFASPLLSKDEFLGCLREVMPAHWNDENIQTLVADFYQKYTAHERPLTMSQEKVFRDSLCVGGEGAQSLSGNDVQKAQPGDTAPLSAIYASSQPPLPPAVLPRLVKAVTAPVPDDLKATVAMGTMPALGAYPKNLSFRYIDNQPRELRMNCLTIAGTGKGKDSCLTQPLNHILAPMRQRDAESRESIREYNEAYNKKASNKEKPQRPNDVPVQNIKADITRARLAQAADDAQGATLFVRMNELEEWERIEGARGRQNQFTTLKKADDEGNDFGQDRAGTQSVNFDGCLRLNWTANTTPAKAQSLLRHVIVEGPLSRLTLATTPDRGIGAPIPVYGSFDQRYDDMLKPFIANLQNATGYIYCKPAYRLAKQLKEELDDFCRLSQSDILDNLGHRALVATFRRSCLIYAANGMKWEKAIEGWSRWSLHYDLWLKIKYFADMISNAEYDTLISKRGPRNLLELLPAEFTTGDASNVRFTQGKDREGTANMLNQWVHRGYILRITNDSFKKVRTNNDKQV